MVFAAVRPNGEPVDLILPVDDLGPTEISVKPGQVLTGDIDLQDVIADLNAMKKSEVLLFWAYKSPDALHIRHWSSDFECNWSVLIIWAGASGQRREMWGLNAERR
jgi:hypothetical protein